jgi:lipid-A-disaccharide synthase
LSGKLSRKGLEDRPKVTPAPKRHIFISCGEASGDRYGAALTAALRSLNPELRISALGGSALAAAGARIVRPANDLAIMGFSEVVSALPSVLRARREVFDFLRQEKPDLVIPIDFPGFNSGLAGKARSLGIPVYWLIAPQVWAWGGWRTDGFRKRIDRLGTILPFEEDFFSKLGFDVFPLGHPLMDDYGPDFPFEESVSRREKTLNSRQAPLVVGLIPGSRKQELDKLLPILKVTSQAVVGHLDGREIRYIVSAAPGIDPLELSQVFDAATEISQEPLPDVLARVDLALVCSGTASLEAALAGVPHELVYRTGAFNYLVGRRLVRTEHIGLSNLIMNRAIVREHLQDQAAPLPLARCLLRWMARPIERNAFYADVRRLRQLCGQPGAWSRAAEDITRFLDGRQGQSLRGRA